QAAALAEAKDLLERADVLRHEPRVAGRGGRPRSPRMLRRRSQSPNAGRLVSSETGVYSLTVSAPTTVLRTVGRYESLQEIGRHELAEDLVRGGMASVYLARQTDLDRNVALKELAAFHAADPSFVQRFLRESRVTGALSHPNIVTVHEYFEHDDVPYIAMEYF